MARLGRAVPFQAKPSKPPRAKGNALAVPGTLALSITTFAPAVSAPRLVTVGKATLLLTEFAPTVATPRLATVGKASLTLTTFAPSVVTPRVVTPAARALSLTSFAPNVGVGQSVVPDTASLILSGFAPTITTQVAPAIGGHAGRRYNPISVAKPIPAPVSITPRPAHLRLLSSPPSVSVTNELSDNELLLLLEAA